MYLGRDELLHIMGAVAKSRSILSVHLTGNQIDDEKVRGELRNLMKPRRRIKVAHEKKGDPEDAAADLEDLERQEEIMGQNPTLSQSKQSAGRAPQEEKASVPPELKDEALVYSRILGHFEMPHSHRWVESQECWLCGNHAYTLILASKSICQRYCAKPTTQEKDDCIARIRKAEHKQKEQLTGHRYHEGTGSDVEEIFYEADAENDFTQVQNKKLRDQYFRNNMLSARFTEWRCKSLLPLRNFV